MAKISSSGFSTSDWVLIAALGVVGYLVYKSKIFQNVGVATGGLATGISDIGTSVGSVAQGAAGALTTTTSGVGSTIGGLLTGTTNANQMPLVTSQGGIAQTGANIGNLAAAATSIPANIFTWTAQQYTPASINSAVQKTATAAATALQNAQNSFKTSVSTLNKASTSAVTTIINTEKSLIKGIGSTISSGVGKVTSTFSNVVSSISRKLVKR